jgi:hypothetical protein
MELHGDAKLTDLLQTLADCQKASSVALETLPHAAPRRARVDRSLRIY